MPASAARKLPGLLRAELAAKGESAPGGPPSLPLGSVAHLEALIEIAHAAADDGSAVERISAEIAARLRAASVVVRARGAESRVLAVRGRPWPGDSTVVQRAIAAGLGAAADVGAEPFEAAEPLRYGGEIIGAVAARWAPGATVDRDRAPVLLRMGALALAGYVRALLDRQPPADHGNPIGDIVGTSEPVRRMREAILRAARAPYPVLVEGESGSGKELVARAIHRFSARRDRRFCPVNCAALTDDLLEAELFGHARGGVHGSHRRARGPVRGGGRRHALSR